MPSLRTPGLFEDTHLMRQVSRIIEELRAQTDTRVPRMFPH